MQNAVGILMEPAFEKDIDVARRDAEHCKARQQEAMEATERSFDLRAVGKERNRDYS